MLAMESSLPRLDLTTYGEAVGDLINLYAVVDKGPEEADASCSAVEGEDVILPRIETALETSDLYPPLYFHSEQRLTGHMAQRGFIRGVARVTPDDPPQIRWTIIIRYGGEDRWRMEGVQVGGRGSKRGFFGVSRLAVAGVRAFVFPLSASVWALTNPDLDRCCKGALLTKRASLVLAPVIVCNERTGLSLTS